LHSQQFNGAGRIVKTRISRQDANAAESWDTANHENTKSGKHETRSQESEQKRNDAIMEAKDNS
jgi:hypothetical protein